MHDLLANTTNVHVRQARVLFLRFSRQIYQFELYLYVLCLYIVCVAQMSFQLYSGGVLTATCGTNLDHGVLLVGYGVSEDGIKYWKVKSKVMSN